MVYGVRIIDVEEGKRIMDSRRGTRYYTSKADICGVCVKLYTEDRAFADQWEDNFYHMGKDIRSHCRIVCINDPGMGNEVLYDRSTFTAFLYNFDYYGWVKSIALALASDLLEDAHSIYSVHGAALDVDGSGVAIIAPSKTGKTTQSWGLLRADNTRLITDDWFFVRLSARAPSITGSERNCYIDADIGDVWDEYKPLVTTTRFDSNGRGIANVRWVAGDSSVATSSSLKHVILLKRDRSDATVSRELTADEALAYLSANDFCNPHQLVRDERKLDLRTRFFREMLSGCTVHMVNTVRPAEETQEIIRSIVL